jgi:hypothetical protein
MEMTRFKTSNQDTHAIRQLDDATLETVVGGQSIEDVMSAQLRLAFHPVGGWTMKDVFATPTLGTYH